MVPQSLKVIVISVITESSVGMTVSNCLQGKTHKHTFTHTHLHKLRMESSDLT